MYLCIYLILSLCFRAAFMTESQMEDVPQFLSMDSNLLLDDYLNAGNYASDICSVMNDEPWKEVSDGSDSGIDSKYAVCTRFNM